MIVVRAAVQSFNLALSGAREGVATWVGGACSYSDASGGRGPVLVSLLHAGTFARPITQTPATTQALWANAVPVPGGATVTWFDYEGSNLAAFSVQIGANGLPGTRWEGTTVTVPLAADGGGDLLFAPVTAVFGPAGGVFVRPARRGCRPTRPEPVRGRGRRTSRAHDRADLGRGQHGAGTVDLAPVTGAGRTDSGGRSSNTNGATTCVIEIALSATSSRADRVRDHAGAALVWGAHFGCPA
jgi:hypothetical protein